MRVISYAMVYANKLLRAIIDFDIEKQPYFNLLGLRNASLIVSNVQGVAYIEKFINGVCHFV
jgi:hypothetical protein